MKDILKLYAIYNRDMNNKIMEILSDFPDEELKKERNIYYKSIFNLFTHIARAGWGYQKGIQIISKNKYFSYLGEGVSPVEKKQSSFSEASGILKETDKAFIEFIESLSMDDLNCKMEKFKMYNNRIVDVSIWEIITQHITHQIHHRGQLSQVLDELNIEHDIGNIWPYVKGADK